MDALPILSALVVISFIGLQNEQALADHKEGDKSCQDGWTLVHRECYKVMTFRSRRQRPGWDAAKKACHNMGGRLSLFPSLNEKNALEHYLQKGYGRSSFWIDLSKVDTSWLWGDKTSVKEDITPWKNAQIRNREGHPCGYIEMSKGKIKLTNSKCTKSKNYICEREKIQTTTSPPPDETTVITVVNNSTISTQASTTKSSSDQDVTTTVINAVNNSAISTQAGITKSSSVKDVTTLVVHPPEKATKIKIGDSQNVIPFTHPPKAKPSSTRIVTMKTGNATPLVLTPPPVVVIKEDVTRPSRRHTTTKETETTTHSEGFKVRTRRVTRSTPAVTTSDDENDDETDSDGITSSPELQGKTTPKRQFPFPTTVVSKGVRRLTSPSVQSTTEANEDDEGEDQAVEETSYETDNDHTDSMKTSTKSGDRSWTSSLPTTRRTSTKKATPSPRPPRRRNDRDWLEARKEFEGCYIPGKKATARQTVLAARQLYKGDADYCPEVSISRLTFSQTEPGESATARCRKGSGFATLECGDDTVCWLDQPDLSGCASPRFKALLKKIQEEQLVSIFSNHNKTDAETLEESVDMTSDLVSMTKTEDISMEDILVTSEVLTAFTHSTDDDKVKVKDQKAVVKIVDNVIKAGNNLFSKKKKAVWKNMEEEDRVRSASSLMVAMETATMSLAEKIKEPTVIKQVEENIEMEIQVVNVEELEEKEQKEIVYETEESDNTFSIPLENLKSVSDGGDSLDKVVFITHYSMADILDTESKKGKATQPRVVSQDESISNKGDGDKDQHIFTDRNDPGVKVGEETVKKVSDEESEEDEEDEEPAPQIASYILSATIGGREGHRIKLPKPVTFTMRHILVTHRDFTTLCSFWDVSQGSGQSFWSQDGCHVKKVNRTHTTCECDHMTSFAILMNIHDYEMSSLHQTYLRLITIIGCCISCMCLIVSWFTFQFCTALQGERNSIHKNLAVCLLVAELLFVAGVTQTEDKIACSVIAVFLHFFFLSAFTWMFLEGLHIIFMLVQVFDASRSRLPHYYITGYGLPAVVVGISCLVYFPGYGTDSFCWLTTDRYFIWAFAGPVALILLVNSVFLTYAMTTVCRHSDYVFNAKDRNAGSPIRSWIQGALALEVLLGLTWMFGYCLLTDNTMPLAYVFTVLNSLQGLFIFIFHCLLNKKVQKEYYRFLRMSLGRFASSASSQSSLGKRTNASTKSHEMAHSNSASRKLSLSYKHNNGNNQDNTNKTNQPPPNNGSVIASIDSGENDIV